MIYFINPVMWNEILFQWRERLSGVFWIRLDKHLLIMKPELLVQTFSFWNKKKEKYKGEVFREM